MANIFGNQSANTLYGTFGNDILVGLGGNDTLIGYAGNDTAWYSGLIKEYLIGTAGSFIVLRDTNASNGDDGWDRLSGVETLSFGNGALHVSGSGFQVNTFETPLVSDPTVTALADGGCLVTWMSYGNSSNNFGICAQRYDAVGNASGSEFKIVPPIDNSPNTPYLGLVSESRSHPSVAAQADGGFVVVWSHDVYGFRPYSEVFGQRYDSLGHAEGSEFKVSDQSNVTSPFVCSLADGGYVVSYWAGGILGSSINAQRYDAEGNEVGSEITASAADMERYQPGPVCALANGGFVITWQALGLTTDNSSWEVFARTYDASGNAVGSEFRVNTYTASDQSEPAVASLINGGFVIAWESDLQDGSGLGIYAQRFDGSGNASGTEFRVNTHTMSDQMLPAVTALGDGGFAVIWSSSGQDGSLQGIYGQRYDADGNASGGEFKVNTYDDPTPDRNHHPTISGLADGGFVVTWISDFFDGNIIAQRFDAAGNSINLQVTGTAGADVLNLGEQTHLIVDGAAGNDSITGGGGDDSLVGGLGNDTLIGGNGDDRLDGGLGNDSMLGGNGSDTYVVNAVTDVVIENGTSGSDTVLASISYTLGSTLENLTLTGYADINGTGNAMSNFLLGNIGNNVLDGKAGGDLMAGGIGDDVYVVDSPFDIVAENINEGFDTVKSAVTFTLGENLEDLILTGTQAIDGFGNSLGNSIDGNSAANTLTGGDGNDTLRGQAGNDVVDGGNGNDYLVGGAGSDTLTGGAGNDTFRFDLAPSATNMDHITDFVSGTDTIFLSVTTFKAFLPGALSGADFYAGSSFANTAAQHILYNTSTGGLYYNADGAGSGVPVLIATLDGHPNLVSGDFVLG